MVYIDRYIPIHKFKYVYVHIRVRQQLETYTPYQPGLKPLSPPENKACKWYEAGN
jgi:hypothetical protein